ncbi:MAG: uroporphyrinogen-III synthase [Pseudomonadota bacterium]
MLADITAAGGIPIHVPAIEIVRIEPNDEVMERLRDASNDDVVVFVSRHAVHLANDLIPLRDLQIKLAVAPGKTTARSLQKRGVENVAVPIDGNDSEAMLRTDALRDIANQRILIVKGEGGRDTLRDELIRRGAAVHRFDAYKRVRPDDCERQLRQILVSPLDAACFASGETLTNVLTCLAPEQLTVVQQSTLFVPSARVAKLASRNGFVKIRITSSPNNEGFAHSLIEWASLNASEAP